MLAKFISMLETRFQNIETTLKNQQSSIQELENQFGQLAKLVFERSQVSLPSDTETNPRIFFLLVILFYLIITITYFFMKN